MCYGTNYDCFLKPRIYLRYEKFNDRFVLQFPPTTRRARKGWKHALEFSRNQPGNVVVIAGHDMDSYENSAEPYKWPSDTKNHEALAFLLTIFLSNRRYVLGNSQNT